MTPGIRHRLTKTDNIQPLPKRASKKPKPKPVDTFDPKPNKYGNNWKFSLSDWIDA